MTRFLKLRKTGIDIASGGDITMAVGSTLTASGTVTLATIVPATIALSNANHFAVDANGVITLNTGVNAFTIDAHTTPGTLAVAGTTILLTGNGRCSGTWTSGTADHFSINANGVITLNHDGTDATIDAHTVDATLALSDTNISLDGAANVTGTLNSAGTFTVTTNALTVTATTGVVTMKNGCTLDNNAAADTLTITETKVTLAANTTVSGTLAVSGATFSVGTGKFSVASATGILTLGNSMVIDGDTVTDAIRVGALMDFCNDGSPSGNGPANGMVFYVNTNELLVKRNSDNKVSAITTHTGWS